MRKLFVLAFIAGITVAGLTPANAQVIPSVRGVSAFTTSTNFMSLPGYVRWQYFVENNVWITRAEAAAIVASQAGIQAQ